MEMYVIYVPHQVYGDASSDDEAHVDVDGVAAVLGDLGQAGQGSSDGKRKHQHGLQQLSAVGDGGVEVHLAA